MQYSFSSGPECNMEFCLLCRLPGEIMAAGFQTSKTLANRGFKPTADMEMEIA